MTATFEPLPIQYPDVEMVLADYLRALAAADRSEHIYVARTHPTLPVTISGTTYDYAVVVRDDGGPNGQRNVSLAVRGKPGATYTTTRSIAEWCASRLRILPLAAGVPVSRCDPVRGPMSITDDPPEFQITADLTVIGQVTTS